MAVGYFVVKGKAAQGGNAAGITAAEPVQDVYIVCAFLEQQTGRLGPFRVPVLEIGVPAVGGKMPAPAHLHLADGAFVNQFLHLQNKGHVAHVVTEVEFGLLSESGLQNPVATFNGNRHRFFQVNRFSRLQGRGCVFLVHEIRRSDENRIYIGSCQELPVVFGNKCFRSVFFLEFRQKFIADVGSGNNFYTFFRFVRMLSQRSAAADSNNANVQIFHGFISRVVLFGQ